MPSASRAWRSAFLVRSSCRMETSAATVETIATRIVSDAASEVSAATAGLRRHQRQARSRAELRRARIVRSARNRSRSSARACAETYRSPDSRAIAFRTIVSRSLGILGSIDRGLGTAPLEIRSISLSRSDSTNAGRRVSISYSVAPSA